MIYEVAEIDIIAGENQRFEAAVAEASQYFKTARGFHSMGLTRSIEHPNRYRLIVGWETVDDHMVEFRQSPGFQEWRRLASPFFASPPKVEHTSTVFKADVSPLMV